MKDMFANHSTGLSAPLNDGFDITPADTFDLREVTRAILVGQPGDIAVQFVGGGAVTIKGLRPGVIYPLRLVRVLASGTTATDLVGMV